MAISPWSRSSAPLLCALWSLLVVWSCAASQCYMPNGTSAPDWQLACDSSASVSACCSESDLCLSNGLCLNANGNNAFTIQGCTDADASSPCLNYCADKQDSLGLVYMWLCNVDASGATKGGEFCCGGYDTSCCDSSSSSSVSLISIAAATSAWAPTASAANAAATTKSTTSQTKTATTSATATGTSGAQSSSSSDTSSSGLDEGSKVGLGVGLGLGIPALALLFIMWKYPYSRVRQFFQRGPSTAGAPAGIESTDKGQEALGYYSPPPTEPPASGHEMNNMTAAYDYPPMMESPNQTHELHNGRTAAHEIG